MGTGTWRSICSAASLVALVQACQPQHRLPCLPFPPIHERRCSSRLESILRERASSRWWLLAFRWRRLGALLGSEQAAAAAARWSSSLCGCCAMCLTTTSGRARRWGAGGDGRGVEGRKSKSKRQHIPAFARVPPPLPGVVNDLPRHLAPCAGRLLRASRDGCPLPHRVPAVQASAPGHGRRRRTC